MGTDNESDSTDDFRGLGARVRTREGRLKLRREPQPGGALRGRSMKALMTGGVPSVWKKKQSIAEAPTAITVISQDEMARSGFSTIPDMLRMVPGMDVAR